MGLFWIWHHKLICIFLSLCKQGILPGAVPAQLVNYRSHQAPARVNFARFICLSPGLSAPGSPRMHNDWITLAFGSNFHMLPMNIFTNKRARKASRIMSVFSSSHFQRPATSRLPFSWHLLPVRRLEMVSTHAPLVPDYTVSGFISKWSSYFIIPV